MYRPVKMEIRGPISRRRELKRVETRGRPKIYRHFAQLSVRGRGIINEHEVHGTPSGRHELFEMPNPRVPIYIYIYMNARFRLSRKSSTGGSLPSLSLRSTRIYALVRDSRCRRRHRLYCFSL